MTELIQRLQDKAGLTPAQAEKSIDAIKEYIVEKFPMLATAVENMFSNNQLN